MRFIKFDIVDFYPSISEKLLMSCISYAKKFVDISEQEIEIILHTRKCFLFDSDGAWVKRNGGNFDVSMGSYDGAEVCTIVGLYMLEKIGGEFGKKNVGLYRDDGLGVFPTLEARGLDIK